MLLDGILVADFSRVLAGPYCTQVLADLGAGVVKVERGGPGGTGDDTRGWGPSYFLGLNRGKKSIALDLKDPGDLDAARRLVERADVVVESFRPGVMARFGLVRDLNPGAVWCHVSAFGAADLPGYDLLLQALGGLMHVTGEPDGPPLKVGAAVVDLVCGLHAAIGILAALRSGEGAEFEVTLMDSALVSLVNQASAYLNEGVSPMRMGNRHPAIAPYETFGDVAIACGNDAMFVRLCGVLGLDELAADERFATNDARVAHRDELSARIEAALTGGVDWAARLNAAGVPAGPVNDVPAAFAFAESLGLEPVWDVGGVRTVRSPLRGLAEPTTRPPQLGEHTEEILRWLRPAPGGSSSGA
jgi:crotonobetainyl-CoA:carnitine CoA-transferase CaiB-like acyl-CoA transferase